MGLLKIFSSDNSTVVGLCDLTQKTTNELYKINTKEKILKKASKTLVRPETTVQPRTIREAQIQSQAQPKVATSSNPFAPKSFAEVKNEVFKPKIQTEVKTINSIASVLESNPNFTTTPNKRIVNAMSQRQQARISNFALY